MPAASYRLSEHILFPPTRVNMAQLKERLKGKNVLITGASFGIGEQLAYMLADTGAHLILVARTEEKLVQVKKEVALRGGRATVVAADLAKEESVADLITALNDIPGGIDIVINNAGKSIRRSLYESLDRLHDFKRSMAINYFGPVQLLLALIPTLKRNKGYIINISAINVLMAPAPHWAAYQSSKAAFDNWFRCAAPELNAAGVYTTSIYLPLVRTRMIEPTPMYDKMPAMNPEHAARWICKVIITRQQKKAPWWLMAGQLSSVVFRGLWELLATRYLKKKPPYAP